MNSPSPTCAPYSKNDKQWFFFVRLCDTAKKRSIHSDMFHKIGVLINTQNSHENMCRRPFLIMLQAYRSDEIKPVNKNVNPDEIFTRIYLLKVQYSLITYRKKVSVRYYNCSFKNTKSKVFHQNLAQSEKPTRKSINFTTTWDNFLTT